MKKRKKHTWLIAALCVFAALTITVVGAACIYLRFGGFGTGECADTTEFSKYAVDVSKISIPEETQILALGEATHGNKKFQRLRLDVFKVAVEKYGVRAFALEGDFGGCEKVNRYINGGEGTAKEALSAIGFAIYRTDETESLVEWMRDYNSTAENGEKLRFYGFDMEQYAYNYCYFLEALKNENADVSELEKIWDSGDGIDSAFSDIEKLSQMCRYSNCTHRSEPGCAARKTLEDGALDIARLDAYRKLIAENSYAADSSKYMEAKKAKFKEISKINKSARKNKF